jgi:hypothetical protein
MKRLSVIFIAAILYYSIVASAIDADTPLAAATPPLRRRFRALIATNSRQCCFSHYHAFVYAADATTLLRHTLHYRYASSPRPVIGLASDSPC